MCSKLWISRGFPWTVRTLSPWTQSQSFENDDIRIMVAFQYNSNHAISNSRLTMWRGPLRRACSAIRLAASKNSNNPNQGKNIQDFKSSNTFNSKGFNSPKQSGNSSSAQDLQSSQNSQSAKSYQTSKESETTRNRSSYPFIEWQRIEPVDMKQQSIGKFFGSKSKPASDVRLFVPLNDGQRKLGIPCLTDLKICTTKFWKVIVTFWLGCYYHLYISIDFPCLRTFRLELKGLEICKTMW